MTRVLVTGSRNWTNPDVIARVFDQYGVAGSAVTVVHGGQVSYDPVSRMRYGADYFADILARRRGCKVEKYPADWKRHRKQAGPIRNAYMVSLGADFVLAFPLITPTSASTGTLGCMRLAEDAGIVVHDHGWRQP